MGDTNQEIEVKLRVADPNFADTLVQRLKEAGLDHRPTERFETNLIYDKDNELRDKKQVLRIRVAQHGILAAPDCDYAELTFKDKGTREKGVSSRTELNVPMKLNDARNMQSILCGLGYDLAFLYEKKRLSFSLPYYRAVVELDEVPYLGFFLEIEAPNAEIIEQIIEKLNLGDLERAEGSYIKLLKDEMKKRDIKGREAMFDRSRDEA